MKILKNISEEGVKNMDILISEWYSVMWNKICHMAARKLYEKTVARRWSNMGFAGRASMMKTIWKGII